MKTRIALRLVSLGVVMSILMITTAFAELGDFKSILEKKELVVGTSGDFPPFTYIGNDGEARGIDIDLAKMFADWIDVKLRIKIIPFENLIQACLNNEIDLIISCMSITGKRNTALAFTNPYYISGQSLLTLTGAAAKFSNNPYWPKDPDLKLAVQSGTTSEQFSKRYKAHITKVKSLQEALILLKQGRVDAVITDDFPARAWNIRNPEFYVHGEQMNREPIGIGTRPDFLLINALNNFLIISKDEIESKIFPYVMNPDWIKDLP